MKQPEPINRRRFLKKAALGAAATPFFLKALEQGLTAQESAEKMRLFWIEGRSAGLQRTGFFSEKSALGVLKNRYDFQNHQSLFSLNESDRALTSSGKILVFEGGFPASRLEEAERAGLEKLLLDSKTVILLGNQASFGDDNFLLSLLRGRDLPFIRLTGFPVHNHHILGTLSHVFLYGIPDLDVLSRPKMHYGKVVCDYCEYNGDLLEGNFVNYHGEREGCLYKLGCKGPFTRNTCPTVRWNGTESWCVSVGAPCSGCSEETFPEHGGYGLNSNSIADSSNFFLNHSERFSKILLTLTVFGTAIHAVSLKSEKQGAQEEENYGEGEMESLDEKEGVK